MAILIPNVLFGNLLKHVVFKENKQHIVFKENKQQMRKGINGLFAATLNLTFQRLIKSKKTFHQCTMDNSTLY